MECVHDWQPSTTKTIDGARPLQCSKCNAQLNPTRAELHEMYAAVKRKEPPSPQERAEAVYLVFTIVANGDATEIFRIPSSALDRDMLGTMEAYQQADDGDDSTEAAAVLRDITAYLAQHSEWRCERKPGAVVKRARDVVVDVFVFWLRE